MHKKNSQLARCPHCDSVFEVSEAEMQPAFGAVRCGECMKIFNARFHQVEALRETPQSYPETEASSDPIPTLRDYYYEDISPHHQEPDDPEAETNRAENDDDDYFAPASFDMDSSDTQDTDPFAALRSLEMQPHQPEARKFSAAQTDAKNEEFESEGLEEDDFEDEDETLTTEARTRPQTAKSGLIEKFQDYKWGVAAGSLVFALALAATAWFFLKAPTTPNLVAEEVRISPSMHPQKMEVHFQLQNEGNTILPVKLFQVELLNLSGQVIASEKVSADSISGNPNEIAPRESLPVQLEVERPATYVQGARIQSLKSGAQ